MECDVGEAPYWPEYPPFQLLSENVTDSKDRLT